jgi:hypothetical protein
MAPVRAGIKSERRKFLRDSIGLIVATSFCDFNFLSNAIANDKQALSLKEFWQKCEEQKVKEVGLTHFAHDIKLQKFQRHQLWRGSDGFAFLVSPKGDFAKFELPIPAHSFQIHPQKKNLAWAIPGFDKKSLLIDVREGKVVDTIEVPGLSFYGHGIILPEGDGNHLFMTMYGDGVDQGKLVQFDLKSKKVIKILETKQDSFHELKYVASRKSFYIAGKNSKSACFYEVGAEDLSLRKSIPCPKRFEFRHLEVLNDGRVLLAGYGDSSEPYPFNMAPIVMLDVEKEKMTPLEIDEATAGKFSGEALNCILNDLQSEAFVSNPYQGIVYQVETEKMTLKQIHQGTLVKSFRKIDGKYVSMAVAKGLTHASFFISDSIGSMATGEVMVDSKPSAFGSHLYKVSV